MDGVIIGNWDIDGLIVGSCDTDGSVLVEGVKVGNWDTDGVTVGSWNIDGSIRDGCKLGSLLTTWDGVTVGAWDSDGPMFIASMLYPHSSYVVLIAVMLLSGYSKSIAAA